jgi:membrane-bound lytic murein transglycosylase D
MIKTFLSALMISFCLINYLPPADSAAVQDLQEIKEKEHISRMYDRAVEFFTRKIPEDFAYRLNNSYKYIDAVMAIFGEKGIPPEIAYLPFLESGFSPASVGPGDAAGLWQFMKVTAQKYGLIMDAYVDERKDPVKSTYAAAAYLRDLHTMFGQWDIALAAYNAGEGKIKRIISGKNAGPLPAGFSRYVARLLAVFNMAQEPQVYGFMLSDDTQTWDGNYKEITTSMSTSLKKIAAQNNTTVTAIREMNPALLRDKTPPYRYVIRVPADN